MHQYDSDNQEATYGGAQLERSSSVPLKPRLILADAEQVLLESLAAVLSSHFEILALVTQGHQLLALARQLQPDVVVTERVLPHLNGIEAARVIMAHGSFVKIVMLTTYLDAIDVKEALDAGVSGYASKTCTCAELTVAIRESLAGRSYISAAVDQQALWSLQNAGRPSGCDPTPRQREMLQLLAEGYSAKQIAHTMRISEKTVQFHKSDVMTRIGARSSAELIRYAVKRGLVT